MLYPILAASCVLFLATTAVADDKAKPNTLTAKEIADGWILLFDGETTFGWTSSDNALFTSEGQLVLPPGKGCSARTKTALGAGELKFVFAYRGNGGAVLNWGDNTEVLSTDFARGITTKTVASKGAKTAPVEFAVGEKTTLGLTLVAFRPAGLKPLFTGKDLASWKVNAADPKRRKSKFTVTADGELSVKDGPGDFVTEKEFANFVLQFECKTLGDGLNSGIFFRCIPGQYQNGYEAQIQNAYLDNDRSKPKDFGTGAIYRRVKARKVVANDNEWFTMTVVANGNHFATWVNGYQTVEWSDDRKPHDNPRQGYRAAKGPISIQGHDPTTNLLFRNLRVEELPGK